MARPLKLVSEKAMIGRGPGKDAAGRPLRTGPGFKRVIPVKPDDLTAVASLWWDDVVPSLVAADITSTVQESALTIAAEAWSRWKAAQAIINSEGLTTQDSRGVVRCHPAVSVVVEASKEYQSWCRLFGLTPADEQRVGRSGANDGAHDNPFAGSA